jgi:hypothetical protein
VIDRNDPSRFRSAGSLVRQPGDLTSKIDDARTAPWYVVPHEGGGGGGTSIERPRSQPCYLGRRASRPPILLSQFFPPDAGGIIALIKHLTIIFRPVIFQPAAALADNGPPSRLVPTDNPRACEGV